MSPLENENTHEASYELTEKFREILRENGILDEVKNVTITEPPELKGEHFATATVYVKIEFKDSSIKPKNLFMKKFTNSEVHTAMVKEMRVMEKEALFFNSFLPAVKRFCQDFEGTEDLLNFFPKCLYADDDRVVLENLVLDDTFIMLPKEDKQDLFTTKFVLNNLAKFHAATYAMIEKEGRERFRTKWEAVCAEALLMEANPVMAGMFDSGMATCINFLNAGTVEGSTEAIETLQSYIGKTFGIIKEMLLAGRDGKITVINHGDLHNNNMLFKKDPVTGKVSDNVLVDLQITRYGSPNLDIGYFLYTSVKPNVRRAHLREILEHYFDVFGKSVALFKLTVPMSFEEFFEDYKKSSQLGFYVNLSFICAMGGAMKDVDIENLGADPNDMMKAFNDAIEKWIVNHPEQANDITTEIVAVLKEQKALGTGK